MTREIKFRALAEHNNSAYLPYNGENEWLREKNREIVLKYVKKVK